MADTPVLPASASQTYHNLLDALPNDDTRRGYLLYHDNYDGKMKGAKRLARGWDELTPMVRQEFINRANRREASHASDPELRVKKIQLGKILKLRSMKAVCRRKRVPKKIMFAT
jgi:hypothetical protein